MMVTQYDVAYLKRLALTTDTYILSLVVIEESPSR